MYFPYLRGRQAESFAVRNAALKIQRCGRILPVFEPTSAQLSGLRITTDLLGRAEAPFGIIVNPNQGALKHKHEAVHDGLIAPLSANGRPVRPAFLLHPGVPTRAAKRFLEKYDSRPVILVHAHTFRETAVLKEMVERAGNVEANLLIASHTSPGYRAVFRNARPVLLEDHFNRQKKNADYTAVEEEFFSEQHKTYSASGLFGFGDFSVVGDFFSENGGRAAAVPGFEGNWALGGG